MLAQARAMVENEFPGLQKLRFHEGPQFTITVFAEPRNMEEPIREFLRLQGAVFLFWKTGEEFRFQLAKARMGLG